MRYQLFDSVVLKRDLPEQGLRAGDLGAIVEIYQCDGIEVEFVTVSGKTGALVTLRTSDVRSIAETDLVAP